MKRLANTKTAAATALVAAAVFFTPAGAGAFNDATPPGGWVGGVHSPASGTLELRLYASDSGWGLAGAEASLDGQKIFVGLGSGACPADPSPGGPEPPPGGQVPSTLALSLGEPSPFRRAGRTDLFTSLTRAWVTATDVPVRLSLADGEVSHGRRLGHLVSGHSILSPALEGAVTARQYRPLDIAVPPPLRAWSEPVSGAQAKIRLRQEAPTARAVRNHHKLLLVTLTAGGP